jgi:hypothetical protein
MHLEKSVYQFVKLVTSNFANHIELTLNVFGHRTKAEFDDLRNLLDSQIQAVYSLAQYSEGIWASAEKLFVSHNNDNEKVKK